MKKKPVIPEFFEGPPPFFTHADAKDKAKTPAPDDARRGRAWLAGDDSARRPNALTSAPVRHTSKQR